MIKKKTKQRHEKGRKREETNRFVKQRQRSSPLHTIHILICLQQ